MGIKWKNPKNGGCLYFDRNGYRYYIIDKMYSDGSISRYWHIERRKRVEPNRKKFSTFWELHFAMFNENPVLMDGRDKESTAYWSIRRKTDYVNCGNDNTKTYAKDGRHFAVNLQSKEFWEYSVSEVVSPDMEYDECKQYAEKYLFKEDTLF